MMITEIGKKLVTLFITINLFEIFEQHGKMK